MWVRGLKLIYHNNSMIIIKSHPMWVRGLKLYICRLRYSPSRVAPHVGAWIETIIKMRLTMRR